MQKTERKIDKIYNLLDINSPKKIEFIKADEVYQFLFLIILSAQSTDKSVMRVAPVLFQKYPTLLSFAHSDIEDLKSIIKSIGFYNNKAQNIKNTAKMLVEKYNGVVPLDIDILTTLPGVGRKTANCIIGHYTKEGAIIVDTHFKRVVNRLGIVKSNDELKIELKLKKMLESKKQFRFSMTANLFGREICHKIKPECEKCYLCEFCSVK